MRKSKHRPPNKVGAWIGVVIGAVVGVVGFQLARPYFFDPPPAGGRVAFDWMEMIWAGVTAAVCAVIGASIGGSMGGGKSHE
jgi:hypothetical protein